MKARLVPLFFKTADRKEFDTQLITLKKLLTDEADILEPVETGAPLPDADAVLFPQLVGEAYRKLDSLKKTSLPMIVATSEFGTVKMWDWEIVNFFKTKGLNVFSPYNLELTKRICRSLALKRTLKNTHFLVFQDNPGEGMQSDIFKRFYWWEKECTDLMKQKFGIRIIKKSFKKMGGEAQKISDDEAEAAWQSWNNLVNARTGGRALSGTKSAIDEPLRTEGVSKHMLNSAVKVYIAVKRELEKDSSIKGIGINCLNESFYSDTTPCLAWNMLYEEMGIMWACEADVMSLLTKYIIHKSLDVPIMMSNIYPFLMGLSALKHEKIDKFPDVDEPENHILVVHCGYFGVVPRPFCTEWTLRPKVLAIVNDNAIAIDGRMPEGPVTLAKLDPTMTKLQVIQGELTGYVQYPGTDCRNGALIRVKNGYGLMDQFYSHHNLIITGHKSVEIRLMARTLGLEVDEV
jgi:hypothetical protein